uniref:Uncharacterized protein n=1 Tax=Trichobilharzia regenti TaxID=157069 RepID=A0AA85K3M7_TRIRE|nr:unnamed protein product [Trichobilharzia regenti]
MTLRRIHLLNHTIKFFHSKSYTPCQKFLCSYTNSPDSKEAISDAEKLIEFFKKAEKSVVENKSLPSNNEVRVTKQDESVETDTTGTSQLNSTGQSNSDTAEEQGRKKASSLSFVPWTMSTLLKEMNISKLISERSKSSEKSFDTLLRYSPFIQLGDFKSRELVGVVIDNVNDTDLYIDFGGKFHCVCPQPDNQFYPRGSLVRIRLKNPELTDKFMINTKGISIFEAEATLLGPYKGRLVKSVAEEERTISATLADGTKRQRSSTDEDCVALEHWRLK